MREFSSYREMSAVHQKDINEFPMIFLFGKHTDEELKVELARIGAKSIKECCSVFGAGDIINRKDKAKLLELLNQQHKEREHFAESENNLLQMILSEMNNHEYSYTRDPYDTLMALGRSMQDFDTDEKFSRAWAKAQITCFGSDCFD